MCRVSKNKRRANFAEGKIVDLPKKNSGLGIGGPKSRHQSADPASFAPKAPDIELNCSWEKLHLVITGDLSSSWFGLQVSEGLAATRNALDPKSEDTNRELPDARSLHRSFEDLGAPVQFNESKLAQRVLDWLDGRLPVKYRHGLVQINSNLFINANELDGHEHESFLEGGEADQTWFAPWATCFGSRVFINMKSFVNGDKKETVAFFVQGLIGTRAANFGEDGKLSEADSQWRDDVLPELAKRLLYLAETPFPSSILDLSRKLAFGEVDESFWPEPFYKVSDFELTLCPTSHQNNSANAHIFPQVVSFGWLMRDFDEPSAETIFSSVIDSMVRVCGLLEDGFRNFAELGVSFGWKNLFGGPEMPEWDASPGSEKANIPRWIPMSQIGDLNTHTETACARAHENSDESLLRWCAEFGAGSGVSSAINTLVYSYLIPADNYDEAVGYLEAAIKLDHYDQSTNALSNLAQVFLAMGKIDDAEVTFLEALERSDKYAEGEASLKLALLYQSSGRVELARKYLERASQSGDAEYSAEAKALLGESAQASSHSSTDNLARSRLASYCTECGTQFLTESQKFCPVCGQRR